MSFALVPIPQDLPTVTFGQPVLYRLEIALVVFYGCLLLITPAISGLAWGRLPTEISTRGAKFAEEASRSAVLDEATIRRLEKATGDLAQELTDTQIEMVRLSDLIESDNAQPKVDSKR